MGPKQAVTLGPVRVDIPKALDRGSGTCHNCSMAVTLASAPWAFDLVLTDDGRYLLTVVCGTVGLYEIVIELEADEVAAWNRDGEQFLQVLVNDISATPSQFLPRHLGTRS